MGVHIASPQLYAYKKEKLQELEQQYREGLIDLYFGDGSFTCTEGYVLYGWQFPNEKITIPSDRCARLNILGMDDFCMISSFVMPASLILHHTKIIQKPSQNHWHINLNSF